MTDVNIPELKELKDIGERIYFGERSGRIIGHTICKRIGYHERYEQYYIVELDAESWGYLSRLDSQRNQTPAKDFFVSVALVHVDNPH